MDITPISGHTTYGATKDGRIFCLRTEKELKYQNSVDNYKRVYLINKDGTKQYSVARLIGTTFIPNPENKPEIDHIDRNRQNNNVNNLKWATDEEQCLNKKGWGKFPRFIHLEKDNEKNRTYECFRIYIKNTTLKYSKRYPTYLYSLEEVIKERNIILKEYNIPITD